MFAIQGHPSRRALSLALGTPAVTMVFGAATQEVTKVGAVYSAPGVFSGVPEDRGLRNIDEIKSHGIEPNSPSMALLVAAGE